MSGRPSKKLRKLSTDSEDDGSPIDWADPRDNKKQTPRRAEPATASGRKKTEESRPRRATAAQNSSSATVSRGPPSASSTSPTSLRLTVKTSSTKLQQATNSTSPPKTVAVNSREKLEGANIIEGKRARNTRKSYVLQSESDEDEEMDDIVDDDVEGESADEDEDAEGEDEEDAEGDIEMEVSLPPPVITVSKAKSRTTATQPASKLHQAETRSDSEGEGLSDDSLSDLGEEAGEDDGIQVGDEDAEGEDDDMEVDEEAEDDDEELDSNGETPMDGSRASTPDLTKLTKRQRARLEEGGSGHLLALPDEVQVKKHLTAEEHAMRRAEMARRRKNLSEKRNEEEKMETINKLLKKQAPKTNARRGAFNPVAGNSTPDSEQKPDPIFVRWVSNKDGNRIGVPEEWLDGPLGDIFQGGVMQSIKVEGRLIQEVE